MTSAAPSATSLHQMSPEAFRAHLAKARANLEFLGAFQDDASRVRPAPSYAPQHLIKAFTTIIAEARRRGVEKP